MQHRYLMTLEVIPLEVGKTYPELPSHLTLMSRFLSDLSATKLADFVRPIVQAQHTMQLRFTETTQLGPKKLTVHMVEILDELTALHDALLTKLRELTVTFEYPQFVGTEHKPHVTKREGDGFVAGVLITSPAVCLVEVVDGGRVIRKKFALRDSELKKTKTKPELTDLDPL